MFDDQEITAAAAAGAAAAVQEVQDQQAQEDVVARAADEATIAASRAEDADDAASAAAQAADMAVSTAASAEQTAQAAVVGLTDVYDRIGAVESKQEEFFGEVRGFFERLTEQQKPDDSVQKVEVTHHAPTADADTTGTGEEAADTGSGSRTSPQRSETRRHRFGHR